MGYFEELPNLEYVNRFPNTKSNDETIIGKNIFRRAKIREDVASVISGFQYYNIVDGERPEQIAERLYGDPELDWVILIANNIINLENDWPLTPSQFNNYLISKYGSETALTQVKYYKTKEVKDSFGRVVLPREMIVDEDFHLSPKYEAVPDDELPPGITFPSEYLDPIVAITSARLGTVSGTTTKVVSVDITNGGRGYDFTPTVTFSGPTTTLQASASCGISSFHVSSIVGLDTGKGYRFAPTITISSPPESIQATATASLGTGTYEQRVNSVSVETTGLGYGNTAPSVEFSFPSLFIQGATFRDKSPIAVGNQLDGMYIDYTGTRLYTSSTFGSPLLSQFSMSTSWDVTTTTPVSYLDVSTQFSYCSGIELSPDGTKMFVVGGKSGSFLIARYDLSTPWDISTGTYYGQSTVTAPGGVRLNPEGTRLYLLNGNTPDSIETYYLGTAWNIVTKGPVQQTFSVETPTGDNQILGFSFAVDGTKMFATGISGASIYEFKLSTAWDLSTAEYQTDLYVGSRLTNPSDAYIDASLQNLIVSGGADDKLYQYRLNSRAEGVAEISGGSLTNIIVTKPGYGYTEAPTVTVSSPYTAVTATATANLSVTGGYVESITITEGGFGYLETPTLTISSPPEYSTAIGIASVSNGILKAITVVDGGLNYDSQPTISLFPSPNQTQNLFVGDEYGQNDRTWRWTGSGWEEKITDGFRFLDNGSIKTATGSEISYPVTNYQYEFDLNETKRTILVPKKTYLTAIIRDLREIMKYDTKLKDSVNSKLRKTYNPKFTGV